MIIANSLFLLFFSSFNSKTSEHGPNHDHSGHAHDLECDKTTEAPTAA